MAGEKTVSVKTIDKIPEGKLKRAGKILKTGLKVGKNYAAYYGEKIVNKDVSKDQLDRNNAADIMESLQELKGGGLKMAQMLSMEKNILPKAYVDQFSLAQFSVPPLSSALVKKTFRAYFKKDPENVFDKFDYKSKFAASIGQVHEAWLNGKKLAVKIQYPGVGNSIQSDLALIKPMASRLLKLDLKDSEKYFSEVESKLLEETDYNLELQNSMELANSCGHLEGILFPQPYPEYSNHRILTMDWIDGIHLSEFVKEDIPKDIRNAIGEKLWYFYMYQFHKLKKVHADPHPGNIIITKDNEIGIIDFGCVKDVPQDFYEPYARLLQPHILDKPEELEAIFYDLEILYPQDSIREKEYFFNMFYNLLRLAMRPYTEKRFDFSDNEFFEELAKTGEKLSKESLTSEFKPNRGSKHFIYINRTFFGLYQLLHLLGAEIDTYQDLSQFQ